MKTFFEVDQPQEGKEEALTVRTDWPKDASAEHYLSKPFSERLNELVTSVDGTTFQILAHIACSGGIMAINLVFYNMAYMELVPKFKCTDSGSDLVYSCTEAEFCGNSSVNF